MSDEMETLASEVAFQHGYAPRDAGTYLPSLIVDKQVELGERSERELAAEIAHILVALALKHPGSTPRAILAKVMGDFKMTDESWHERVRPELVKALAARGIADAA